MLLPRIPAAARGTVRDYHRIRVVKEQRCAISTVATGFLALEALRAASDTVAPRESRTAVVIERVELPELGPTPGYSYAVVAHGMRTVYTAGAVPLDADGLLVGEGDLAVQADKVVSNLLVALEAAGAGVDDIVKTTVFVVASERATLGRAWRFFEKSGLTRPPSTLLGVTFLGYEGQLIEVEAIAVLP